MGSNNLVPCQHHARVGSVAGRPGTPDLDGTADGKCEWCWKATIKDAHVRIDSLASAMLDLQQAMAILAAGSNDE